ncbi:hypothetical protein EJF36_06745 [Bacillus sp. HMF5848]|uniref:hypothetical protein n=1 Tax=Bacillus sp. HMF5848 TaxID=2495421 RepID=UPI000F79DA0C|nr:hypothetical protein [Bacillus sp. HMF5848]RSK26579.1 hypothetical protein EJF36_06745 [Bacillus sp. HMF5848]
MLKIIKKVINKVPMIFVISIATLVFVGLENIYIFGGLEVNSYDEAFLTEVIVFLYHSLFTTLKWTLVISSVYYLSKYLLLTFFTFLNKRLKVN